MNYSFKHIIIFLWCFAAFGKVAAGSVTGRMTGDSQKGTVAYNHLGLTKSVTKGTDILKYTYDATGRRVKRQFKTEAARHYIDGVEYEGSVLKFVATPYGRIRKDASGVWNYDYFLKDHLGNVRVVLEAPSSNAQSNTILYMATMEESKAATEGPYFANLDETRADRPYNYPDKNLLNAKLAKVPGKSKGPSILLPVLTGDTISISAKAFYNTDKTLPGKSVDIAPVVGSAIAAMSSPAGTVLGETARLTVDLGAEASQSVALVNVPQIVDKNGEVKPQSGINFILYNSRMEVVEENTGVLLVEDKINEIQTLASDNLIMQEAGFFEVYINNEAQTPVYYDNFTVAATTGNVIEINAYYPYGMIIPGLSLMAIPDKWNGYKFSAKEIQEMTGWYDFHTRPYDPTIGRTPTPDPHAENYYSMSPYSMFGNNPVNNIDPTGMDYWSTNDPEEIKRMLDMLKSFGKMEGFNYGSWNHATDEEFLGRQREDGFYEKLTYNDNTRKFYTSYGAIDENGDVVIHGVSFYAPADFGATAYIYDVTEDLQMGMDAWGNFSFYDPHNPASGRLDNVYTFERFLFPQINLLINPERILDRMGFAKKKTNSSNKGMPHGDGGRALTQAERRIAELEKQLQTATGNEKKVIQQTIKNIRETAQKKAKGETHWRR